MIHPLGIILITGFLGHVLFTKLHLPGLLGMLLAGILIGPWGMHILTMEELTTLGDFRTIALVIILLRAGLGLSRKELHKVGAAAFRMSFIPGILEGTVVAFCAHWLLGFSVAESGMLGFILAAVSPAVVVPRMLAYAEQGLGMKRGVPTLVLAGASVDDVVAITLFSAFLGMATAETVSLGSVIVTIPLSMIAGIVLGGVVGMVLVTILRRFSYRDSYKVILLMSLSFALLMVQDALKNHFEIAALLGVMTLGIVFLERLPSAAHRVARKLNSLWVGAEILLFVLVGAQVNPRVALDAGAVGLLLIVLGLTGRSIGVWISTMNTDFTRRERLFTMVAYTPKATVQAAIGAVPLQMGLPSGELILAIAVLSIIVTAPAGAIAIGALAPRCLTAKNE